MPPAMSCSADSCQVETNAEIRCLNDGDEDGSWRGVNGLEGLKKHSVGRMDRNRIMTSRLGQGARETFRVRRRGWSMTIVTALRPHPSS